MASPMVLLGRRISEISESGLEILIFFLLIDHSASSSILNLQVIGVFFYRIVTGHMSHCDEPVSFLFAEHSFPVEKGKYLSIL